MKYTLTLMLSMVFSAPALAEPVSRLDEFPIDMFTSSSEEEALEQEQVSVEESYEDSYENTDDYAESGPEEDTSGHITSMNF